MLKLALLFSTLILASPAFSADWPERLSDLSEEQKKVVESHKMVRPLEWYGKWHTQQTVEDHAIISYQTDPIYKTCADGSEDKEVHYVSLYVQGSRLKHITAFGDYGCFED